MAGNISFKALSTDDDAYRSLTIKQGTSFTIAVAPKGANNTQLDTTGYSLSGTFRSAFANDAISPFDAKAVMTFTGSSVVNDTANGRFLILFPDSLTTAITFKGDVLEGVYDFELTAPDGSKSRPLYGPWSLMREVTTV